MDDQRIVRGPAISPACLITDSSGCSLSTANNMVFTFSLFFLSVLYIHNHNTIVSAVFPQFFYNQQKKVLPNSTVQAGPGIYCADCTNRQCHRSVISHLASQQQEYTQTVSDTVRCVAAPGFPCILNSFLFVSQICKNAVPDCFCHLILIFV